MNEIPTFLRVMAFNIRYDNPRDGDLYYFMDTGTYDQTALPAAVLGDQIPYLKESIELVLTMYEDEPLDVELPTTAEMKVLEAEMAVAGDTATGMLKKATLETGLEGTGSSLYQ